MNAVERDAPHTQTNNDTDELYIQFVDFYFKIRLANPLPFSVIVFLYIPPG